MYSFVQWETKDGKTSLRPSGETIKNVDTQRPLAVVPLSASSIVVAGALKEHGYDVYSTANYGVSHITAEKLREYHRGVVGHLQSVAFQTHSGLHWVSRPKSEHPSLFDPELDALMAGNLQDIKEITATIAVHDPTNRPHDVEIKRSVEILPFSNYIIGDIARSELVTVKGCARPDSEITALAGLVSDIAHYNFPDVGPNEELLAQVEEVYFLLAAERRIKRTDPHAGRPSVVAALNVLGISEAVLKDYARSII